MHATWEVHRRWYCRPYIALLTVHYVALPCAAQIRQCCRHTFFGLRALRFTASSAGKSLPLPAAFNDDNVSTPTPSTRRRSFASNSGEIPCWTLVALGSAEHTIVAELGLLLDSLDMDNTVGMVRKHRAAAADIFAYLPSLNGIAQGGRQPGITVGVSTATNVGRRP